MKALGDFLHQKGFKFGIVSAHPGSIHAAAPRGILLTWCPVTLMESSEVLTPHAPRHATHSIALPATRRARAGPPRLSTRPPMP
jgi:hypothetical protein